jgi:hypothetical protein
MNPPHLDALHLVPVLMRREIEALVDHQIRVAVQQDGWRSIEVATVQVPLETA